MKMSKANGTKTNPEPEPKQKENASEFLLKSFKA